VPDEQADVIARAIRRYFNDHVTKEEIFTLEDERKALDHCIDEYLSIYHFKMNGQNGIVLKDGENPNASELESIAEERDFLKILKTKLCGIL